MTITDAKIQPSKMQLHTEIHTVNDVQRLVGDLQWLRTWCGITNQELEPLVHLLQDSTNPTQPRVLTKAAKAALQQIEKKLSLQQSYRYQPEHGLAIAIYGPQNYHSAVIIQTINNMTYVLEWVFPPMRPSSSVEAILDHVGRLLLKARTRVRQVFGLDPEVIYVPWKTTDLLQMWMMESPAFALATVGIPLSVHYPSHPLFKTNLIITERPKIVSQPICEGLTVFTDASGRTGQYGCAWKETHRWHTRVLMREGVSVQVLELEAIALALRLFQDQPINLVTDSAYAEGVLNRLDHAILGHVGNRNIEDLFINIIALLDHRRYPVWCTHIKSHTTLPGIFTEGNAIIDKAVSEKVVAPAQHGLPTMNATMSHQFFHQSARALQKEFGLSRTQARSIIAACPECARIPPLQPGGTNPRGLQPRGIWQSDVTDISSFGRLRHVHVTVDTCSKAIWATAAPSTAFTHVKHHWLSAFAALGIPQIIKTDNGPAYKSHTCQQFLQAWGIQHKTGIPYNSTGQAIIERRHQDLKRLALILKKEGELSPHNALMKTCYVLNWKNPVGDDSHSPIDMHFSVNPRDFTQWDVLVETWDPQQGGWAGHESKLLTWGKGYACVVTGSEQPRWLPAKWVRPWTRKKQLKNDDVSEAISDLFPSVET